MLYFDRLSLIIWKSLSLFALTVFDLAFKLNIDHFLQKRLKAAEAESKLKQVYIPT